MTLNSRERNHKRKQRVRKKLRGRMGRPRLSVFKSNRHVTAQVIDDYQGKTLVGVATYSKEFRDSEYRSISKGSAAALGRRLAELAKEKGVEEVVLDRGPFKYHGVIAALADAAREAGLRL